MSDVAIDSTAFLSDKFDVQDYAEAVLQGRAYRPDEEVVVDKGKARATDGQGDVGVELARLKQGIEDVTRQLRQEISTSYPLLLAHLTTSLSLSSNLAPIRSSLSSLSTSMGRLQQKIHVPHEQLAVLVRRLHVLAQASDLTRRASRFVLVAKRLDVQMKRVSEAESGAGEGEKERELAKAALSVAELDVLLHPAIVEDDEANDVEALPLLSLDFVKAHAPTIDKARDTVIQEMENMVMTGLADLNQTLLASSLQTAHNLRLLPDLVSNLLADLNDAVTLRISRAFDSAAIGREVAGKDTQSKSSINFTGRSRQSTEPNSSNQQHWVQVLWARLERVIEDVANCCIKVYTLEKVLKIKKDPITQTEFLDDVMKRLDEKPSFTFWTTLAHAFETQTKEAARTSNWLQQALSTGYPRLLRLFHDFFGRIAVHTDTVYTRDRQSPEAVLVLRSVSSFETLYLTRSTTRINDSVTTAIGNYVSSKAQLGPGEGVNIARVITNELDSAKFDPLLVRTVARNGVKVLDSLVSRLDGMMVRDFTATSLIGPQATAAQNVNAQFASCLYHCWYNLTFVESEFPGKVWEILKPAVNSLHTTSLRVTTPLDTAFKREFSAIIGRIHKVDFSRPVDPMSMNGQGGSPYMQDLTDKLAFVKREILGRLSMGDHMKDWVLDLSRYLISVFLLHASIVRPLGESGKLKLTTDMTELEVSIQSLLATGQPMGAKSSSSKAVKLSQIGDEYLALRSLRTILFSDLKTLANPVETVHLPTAVVLHHIIVHGPLRLPHEVHGWSEAEYVLWLQKHTSSEVIDLVEKAVDGQLDGTEDNEETVKLVREVLTHAKEAEAEAKAEAEHNGVAEHT